MHRLSVLIVLFVTHLVWAQPAPDSAQPVAREAPKAIVPQATVHFVIQPWGEVIVDGNSPGQISPPTRSLKLEPGKHVIEIKNVDHALYTETVDLKAGEELTIRHKFSKG